MVSWCLAAARYREFIGDETKRQWEWQVRHEQEHKFWLAVVQAVWGAEALICDMISGGNPAVRTP